MTTVHLIRVSSSDEGTFGRMIFDNADSGPRTIELPWRENTRNISCIPKGKYNTEWYESPHWGWVYHIKAVPNRGSILIHWGNYAGDVKKGLRSDSEGCIILGEKEGNLRGQKVILNSRKTTIDFFTKLNRKDFTLNIIGEI